MKNKCRINIFLRRHAEFSAVLRGEDACYLRNFPRNILVLICFCFFTTCKKENLCDCFKRTGDIVREERNLLHVRNFNFGKGKINAFFRQDSVYKVEIEAGKNLIGLIKAEVKNDTLFITDNNTCNFSRSYKPKINVYISTPDFHSLVQNGVGRIESTGTMKRDTVMIETWSSGDIFFQVDCNYLFTHAHKSTALYLSGKTRDHVSHMWHNSTFFGENLSTRQTSLYNNTTGNFYCQVDSLLTVSVRLTGDVIYDGNPAVKLHDLGGTGKVKRK